MHGLLLETIILGVHIRILGLLSVLLLLKSLKELATASIVSAVIG